MKDVQILKTLILLPNDKLSSVISKFICAYTEPSLGSMSNHDIDLLMFETMVSLGIIKEDASIYEIMRDLKVTRSKARSLLYEYKLRKIENEDTLRTELEKLMQTPLLSNQSNSVLLEVDNPYLIDYIRNELKKLGYVTDGSFHAELVKMSADAFAELYERTISDATKKEINEQLVRLGVKEDTSLKAILPKLLTEVAKSMAKAAFGKVGESLIDTCIKYLQNLVNAGYDISTDNKLWDFINNNECDAPNIV